MKSTWFSIVRDVIRKRACNGLRSIGSSRPDKMGNIFTANSDLLRLCSEKLRTLEPLYQSDSPGSRPSGVPAHGRHYTSPLFSPPRNSKVFAAPGNASGVITRVPHSVRLSSTHPRRSRAEAASRQRGQPSRFAPRVLHWSQRFFSLAKQMIRLWTSARSSASIREQLGAQLLLGILSGRLAAGERLPSVRSLARRLRVHPNTISSVYRDLSARGWMQSRRGSGVFVAAEPPAGDGLAAFVTGWLNAAERRGFTIEALEAEISKRRRQSAVVRRLLVVDPDEELARIMAAEMSTVVSQPVAWAAANNAREAIREDSRVFVHAGHLGLTAPIPGTHPFEVVRLRSAQDFVAGQTRPDRAVLIGVISRSPTVLQWASTLLSALGFPSQRVLLRNPGDGGWQDGLHACDILAADICAAPLLPPKIGAISFRVLSDEWLAALRDSVTVDEVSH